VRPGVEIPRLLDARVGHAGGPLLPPGEELVDALERQPARVVVVDDVGRDERAQRLPVAAVERLVGGAMNVGDGGHGGPPSVYGRTGRT
jgi:hypothetical protein